MMLGSHVDPHEAAPILHAGVALKEAAGAMILLHGRGASAEDILGLAGPIGLPRLAYLAPQAAGSTWYPESFLAPRGENEPWLNSALRKIEAVVRIALAAGLTRERIMIAGFSQGACLTVEFAATHPARYAGLIAFTGGLVGPPGSDLSHSGNLAGTPALLLSGDPDPHVPWSRVQETEIVLSGMGARVTSHRYPGKPHSVSGNEVELARAMVQTAFA